MGRKKIVPQRHEPGDEPLDGEQPAADPQLPKVAGKKIRRKRRVRQGVKALREIRRYQQSTDLLLKRAPFQRLVREISQDYYDGELRFSRNGLIALQEGAESYLTELFNHSNLISLQHGGVTLKAADMKLARFIRGEVATASLM